MWFKGEFSNVCVFRLQSVSLLNYWADFFAHCVAFGVLCAPFWEPFGIPLEVLGRSWVQKANKLKKERSVLEMTGQSRRPAHP